MDMDTFTNTLFIELNKIISKHEGLEIFASERAKFEGWVKVELVRILRKYFSNVVPEKDNIDIVADEWAIEIKTVNTNYRHPLANEKQKPITDNIKDVLEDIEKLKQYSKCNNKIVFFIVFPLPERSMEKWKYHLNKIKQRVKEIWSYRFLFRNGIPGMMYIARV